MDTGDDPVVQDPSTLVRCKSVIGIPKNGFPLSFAILSEEEDGSYALTSVTNKKGWWEAEKLLTHRSSCDVNIVTCKGLIVIYGTEGIHVLNRSKMEINAMLPRNIRCHMGSCGVGFDARIGKYKLVLPSHYGCDVLTLGPLNPIWRLIKMDVSWTALATNRSPMYGSGLICWMVFLGSRARYKLGIFVFKVETETFDLVELPEVVCGDDENLVIVRLVALKGVVCVAKHDKRQMIVEIWMMSEKGWTREHKVDVSNYCRYEINPVCIRNQRIYFQVWNFGLVSYHIEEKRFMTRIYSSNARCLSQCGVYEDELNP